MSRARMVRDVTDAGLEAAEMEDVSDAVQAHLTELFDVDVQVKIYQHRDRLDVHVEPVAVKQTLEEEHPELNVAPYSDFKMTVSMSE